MNEQLRKNRLAQFMPFAALKGYYELIREAEALKEPHKELLEDEWQRLQLLVDSLNIGDQIIVRYYLVDHYVVIKGELKGFDQIFHMLLLKDREIPLEDIANIETLTEP